ncbi:hypothetical protein QBC33DRAFT_530326 [Phialemonium atrogriseum]|uniref:Uncharacterized protein n=1 Tax=Phialemonium atrogriseum TaxID=1093897 RepID=A0AAJ0C583_9PEZI|nr:uncharacterized protein QBC33DRAFT_530326 [Phialemonium atrogriseum]KAK1770185.1 hypothetical protein QBC33DRAFT_530326 [Phialemonium atrogriseum]
MLRGFGNVTIEWTNTITHHLLFVPTTRKLYLFRLPTICAVGCLSDEGKSPILDQVMRDYFEPLETATNIWPRFKQEIILSYRILFGQDKASRKLYLKDVKPTLGDNSDPLMDILSTKTTGSAQIQNLPGELWPRACRNREDKLRKQGEYSISDDLPMLGPRLLVLQELNQRQRPRTLWTFWRDTRDKPKWYTFWLVLIAGAIAIVLSLAQLGVSVAQLVATPS